ncbi:2'-5' RNA ligase superfamily protein [Halopolyspora algeriensis]|uniref:2'-5' RNA ligase superfamily protein n=1 Tax=Halopolyspora algeriensis TaxID=1500506 RepID=A0A368VHM6_9ACTN|nr:2'-5' RNA ligase family protein [Halopolyspora algeriensis]RCW40152.1 2'-5' RNA ligase superfamily protein [Halopolyspora algeriensis]TQM46366.1 2'-5' RNA ligase superfamily protein [Halopolyspora algeriensis]
MAQALDLFFDAEADAAVRALWQRLDDAGIPSMAARTHRRHRPHVTLAMGASIPPSARKAVRTELEALSLPDLWLYTLGTFPAEESVLLLGAITDTEILAVHSAAHDALTGKVTQPSAYYLPGAWIPHCTLARGITRSELSAGFAALHPAEPVRAAVTAVGVTDTRTGEIDVLLDSHA